MTYEETLDFLYHLEVERMDLKLERVTEALRRCGSPQLRFPSLHIAGTNGKGSTAAFLYSILSAAGYRVGLFTSPHLVDFCERIRLGARQITQAEVIEGVAAIRALVESAGVRLTPFEMMTVLAFHAFAREQVDIAVVEVGLGGRLDATNVLSPLVSVITSIGLDHQAYLGPTLAHIAREKGGIIKPKTPVVLGQMEEDSAALLRGIAVEHDSPLRRYGEDFTMEENATGGIDYRGWSWQLPDIRVGLRGRFQYGNAAVAVAAVEMLRSSFSLSEQDLRSGLLMVSWPGRLEIVSHTPLVVLDGAHNPQAMAVLHAELPAVLRGKRAKILFGVMRDKDWKAMVPLLAQMGSEVVITRVRQARAEDPAVLRNALAPFCPVRVIDDARAACLQLLAEAKSDEAIVVCGSLFLIGEIYPLFRPLSQSAPVEV
ncbi:MAG TPA: folylpolyglutamate synthase/dihydrofolate synthase family protein [Methylomirabilota bacterium]|jgi:dihydrofolate synthase/folylpolyglutamate synthase|nr:folylpolyglutamate synthase/dihydrofolate synthase family protein [Methylomirabilota bacterium]